MKRGRDCQRKRQPRGKIGWHPLHRYHRRERSRSPQSIVEEKHLQGRKNCPGAMRSQQGCRPVRNRILLDVDLELQQVPGGTNGVPSMNIAEPPNRHSSRTEGAEDSPPPEHVEKSDPKTRMPQGSAYASDGSYYKIIHNSRPIINRGQFRRSSAGSRRYTGFFTHLVERKPIHAWGISQKILHQFFLSIFPLAFRGDRCNRGRHREPC